MRFSLLRTLGYFVGGLWTARGGRERIEARQLKRLRGLVEKVRQDSPLFQKLYSDLRESSLIELHELPVTRKPDLMRDFDDWLTIRTYPSVLSILVREKEAGRLNIEPALIKVSGETLSDDLCEKARHAFPSLKYKIINAYGCTECLMPS